MTPVASHVGDMAVQAVDPASAQVLTPLSTSPTPLRRATYVRVCDLAKPFSIDDDKLQEEIKKLERSANGEAENEADKSSGRTDTEKSCDDQATSTTGKVDEETGTATAAFTKLRIGGSKENVAEDQFQHQSKPPYKRLSPPSNGFNLCLSIGSVDVVVDKLRVDRSRVRLAEVMVGDETGCVYLRARDDQIDVLKEISEKAGAVVLRNTTIELYQGRYIRLAVTKWGKISTFPDQIASTPSPPESINRRMNYSAIDLNLVTKEVSDPSSPEGGDSSSPSSPPDSFDDARSTKSHTSTSSRPKGRRGSRKQSHLQYKGQNTRLGQVQGRGSPRQPYSAPYPGAYSHAGMMPGMTSAYPEMYSGQGSPEIPQYGYQSRKPGQRLNAYEAEHHRKQQELIAQQLELQQRHHFQQMHLFQQQQENHRRLLQAQQQRLGTPDVSSGGGSQSTARVPSLSSSAFPPIGGSPHAAVPAAHHQSMQLFSEPDFNRSPQTNVPLSPSTVPGAAAPYPSVWAGSHDQTPPTSPMNPRAATFAPTHDQIQSPQMPYSMAYSDPTLNAAPASLYASPSNAQQGHQHQLYSQVAATIPYVPAMQDSSAPGQSPYDADLPGTGPNAHHPQTGETQSAPIAPFQPTPAASEETKDDETK